jgi:hypothetical protein
MIMVNVSDSCPERDKSDLSHQILEIAAIEK